MGGRSQGTDAGKLVLLSIFLSRNENLSLLLPRICFCFSPCSHLPLPVVFFSLLSLQAGSRLDTWKIVQTRAFSLSEVFKESKLCFFPHNIRSYAFAVHLCKSYYYTSSLKTVTGHSTATSFPFPFLTVPSCQLLKRYC